MCPAVPARTSPRRRRSGPARRRIEPTTHPRCNDPMKPLIELRPEGLYCPAGDFHIDPWLPVPRAVITHGHGDHARLGMGEYHAVREGLPILRWRLGEQRYVEREYGEGFVLGDARVSLHPAGHVLGSAQVRIEVDG